MMLSLEDTLFFTFFFPLISKLQTKVTDKMDEHPQISIFFLDKFSHSYVVNYSSQVSCCNA